MGRRTVEEWDEVGQVVALRVYWVVAGTSGAGGGPEDVHLRNVDPA